MWALVADTVPLYSLYAVLFADSGLSNGDISVLFAIWSAVGLLAEIPTGAVADRFSRRTSLIIGEVAKSAGFLCWIADPRFGGFAVGFVLWGLGGAFSSGSLEALLYDALDTAGYRTYFSGVYGGVTAVGLLAQLPAAGAATVLFAVGGFQVVGWVSVAGSLAAAVLAVRLPEAPRFHPESTASSDSDGERLPQPGYWAALCQGVRVAVRSRAVGQAILALAVLESIDAVEEYFPLLAEQWSVPVPFVPLAVLAIPLLGALGAATAHRFGPHTPEVRSRRSDAVAPALLLGGCAVLFLLASAVARPTGLVSIAVGYGLYRFVLIYAAVRLQDSISGPYRATVTSVAAVGSEVFAFAVYAGWALAGLPAIAGLLVAAALLLLLPRLP